MKKRITFFAFAAALAFCYSCSNDETVATNDNAASNEISFRALTNGTTRAYDIANAAALTSFNVTAFQTGTTTSPYIDNVTFTGPDTYNSSPKYYWPTYNLDFYAWSAHSSAGDGSTQINRSAYNTFTVTPTTDAATQADFVFAYSGNVGKAATIPLTFTHKESRIVVKVWNSAANLSFSVTGWRLGFIDPTGQYTYDTGWDATTTANADKVYTSDFSSSAVAVNTNVAKGSAIALTGAQILIPQTLTKATAYANSGTPASGDKVNGSYIAIQYTATNTTTSTQAQATVWGIWPLAGTWEAGKQYTYVIDIADGGYYETNNDSDANLDEVFEGAYIKFASVTVTDWTDGTGSPYDVSM